jgi:inositol oxygenase
MNPSNQGPLDSLEDWDEDVVRRYPEAGAAAGGFRNYSEAPDRVQEFYRLNHKHQTVEVNQSKREQFLQLRQARMGIWEAMELLNQLGDESDPDTELSQIEHLLQTAEAIRQDGHPDWFVITGLVHDLGKVLCLFGEPQWAVTGDTFPVGCRFDEAIVYHEFFQSNPDASEPQFNTDPGIYSVGCGLSNVMLSWGHDEYLYQVCKPYLPDESLAMIRYHSFYAWHREGAYDYLMDDHDRNMLGWVCRFNPYDLYSKSDSPPDVETLKPYYLSLISRFFPDQLAW